MSWLFESFRSINASGGKKRDEKTWNEEMEIFMHNKSHLAVVRLCFIDFMHDCFRFYAWSAVVCLLMKSRNDFTRTQKKTFVDRWRSFLKHNHLLSFFLNQIKAKQVKDGNDEMFHSTTTIYYILKSNYDFIDEFEKVIKGNDLERRWIIGSDKGVMSQKGRESQ